MSWCVAYACYGYRRIMEDANAQERQATTITGNSASKALRHELELLSLLLLIPTTVC